MKLFVGYGLPAAAPALAASAETLPPALPAPGRTPARTRSYARSRRRLAVLSLPQPAIFSEATRLAATTCRRQPRRKTGRNRLQTRCNNKASGDDDINRISYLELNTYLRSTLPDADQTGALQPQSERPCQPQARRTYAQMPGTIEIRQTVKADAGSGGRIAKSDRPATSGFVLPYDRYSTTSGRRNYETSIAQPAVHC